MSIRRKRRGRQPAHLLRRPVRRIPRPWPRPPMDAPRYMVSRVRLPQKPAGRNLRHDSAGTSPPSRRHPARRPGSLGLAQRLAYGRERVGARQPARVRRQGALANQPDKGMGNIQRVPADRRKQAALLQGCPELLSVRGSGHPRGGEPIPGHQPRPPRFRRRSRLDAHGRPRRPHPRRREPRRILA